MADIDVVPKRRTNTWVWIVLAIVVIAVLFWMFGSRARSTAARTSVPPAVAAVLSPAGSGVPIAI